MDNIPLPPRIRINSDPYQEYDERAQLTFTTIRRPRPVEPLTASEWLSNELWCRQTFTAIQRRLIDYQSSQRRWLHSRYPSAPVLQNESLCKSPVTGNSDPVSTFAKADVATQKTLGISEMLEAILRAAAPEVQLTAYRVSASWRDAAEYVIQSTAKSSTWFGVHHPCEPVQFGDPIDDALDWKQPSDEELDNFSREVHDARQMLHDLPDQHTELTPV
jgi:hypothetical protein